MSLRFRNALALALACSVVAAAPVSRRPALRVCADPNNLPFSNERGAGLENQLANLLARDLGADLRYTWWSQRRGFIRNTLNAGTCDVIMAVPTGMDMVLRTDPYYRASYVFLTRATTTPPIASFDDPRLRHLRIGVQMIGDDGANAPPAHALARRGITTNVRGFMVFGDYTAGAPAPASPIVTAVERGDVDVAVVWGPVAGYFARRSPVPLRLTPVSPQIELPFLPFVFDIAMGVRRGDTTLRNRLNDALHHRAPEIDRLLDRFGVPRATAAMRGAGS